MINRIVITGRLTRDPESKYLPDGTAVCTFAVAVDRYTRNQENGEKETDFINCVAFRKNAEFLRQYIGKGRLLAVDGRLQIRTWVGEDGTKRSRAEILVDNVQALDKPKDAGNSNPAPECDPDDPFADE
jgi:single-strand DNA-binding protein